MSKLLKFTSMWQRQVSSLRCKINHSRAASRSGVMRHKEHRWSQTWTWKEGHKSKVTLQDIRSLRLVWAIVT